MAPTIRRAEVVEQCAIPVRVRQIFSSSDKNRNSKSAEVFNQQFHTYAEALKKRNNPQATFGESPRKDILKDNVNKRKRKIPWSNPLFNNNDTTSVARVFLSSIDKRFLRPYKLHKLNNQNTVTVATPNCLPGAQSAAFSLKIGTFHLSLVCFCVVCLYCIVYH